MSHFSEVKTRLSNRQVLKKALLAMGHTIVDNEEGRVVRGYFGNTLPAEFKILTRTHYDIGFVRDEEGNYQVVGDWELMPKVAGITQEDFLRGLKRSYAKTAIQEIAKTQGYDIQCVEDETQNSIEMVVTQW